MSFIEIISGFYVIETQWQQNSSQIGNKYLVLDGKKMRLYLVFLKIFQRRLWCFSEIT